jgi:hypothetical protein
MLKHIGRLYFIHVSALLAVLLATYFSFWLSVGFSLLYLATVYREGRRLCAAYRGNWLKSAGTALVWQMPGLVLAAVHLVPLTGLGVLYHYSFFMLEIWQTQLMPLLSLFPASWLIQGRPVYYYLYFIDSCLLIIWLLLPVLCCRRSRKTRRFLIPPV